METSDDRLVQDNVGEVDLAYRLISAFSRLKDEETRVAFVALVESLVQGGPKVTWLSN